MTVLITNNSVTSPITTLTHLNLWIWWTNISRVRIFPIVVIEGFSDDINDWKDEEAEQLMWQRRRQLYICASRATTFLFCDAARTHRVQILLRRKLLIWRSNYPLHKLIQIALTELGD